MHSIKSQSTPVKDGRHVLGEKTVNACQSPASRNVDALLKTGSPVKRSLFKGLSPRKLSSPFCAGQKRTIDDVEGNEVTKPGSRGIMQLVPSLNKEQAQGSEVQSAAEDGRQQNTQLDATESDQPTDHHNASSLPDKHSYPGKETRPTTTIPGDSEARRRFIQNKAHLLRSRIQSAMHHVRDHEFDRRLSELEAHSRKIPRLSLPSTPISHTVRRATTPPSEETPKPQHAPELKLASRTSSNPSGLSSPPLSAGDSGDEETITPRQNTTRPRLGSPLQLSSPPATVLRGGCERTQTEENSPRTVRGRSYTADEHTMPSQKGDAVDGLLKLMKVENPETLDDWTG